MPRTRSAAQASEAYRDGLGDLQERVRRDVATAWGLIDLDDTERSYGRFVSLSASIVDHAQRVAGAETERYLASFLSAELDAPTTPVVEPDAHVGKDPFGRTLERALRPPLLTVRAQLVQHGSGPAMRAGRARATLIAGEAVAEAARMTLGDSIEADPRIEGWRRLIAGTCAACLAAMDNSVVPAGVPLHRHPNCKCVGEPKVVGVRNRFKRRTGIEIFAAMSKRAQDAIFGPKKAELLRNGSIQLADLIEEQELTLGGVIITEKSLSALAGAKA